MQKCSYRIRVMTRQEMDIAIDWAAAEGWNPGLYDADCFRAADPDGFLVGLLGDEPVATISVVKYGDSFGFLGFYIVKPAYRGRATACRYGMPFWRTSRAALSVLMEYSLSRAITKSPGLRWPIETSGIRGPVAGLFRLIQGSSACPRSHLMR